MIDIGPIKGVVLLGGGKLVEDLAIELEALKIPVEVVTSPRHAQSVNNSDTSLEAKLKKNNIRYLVVSKIDSEEVKEFLKSSGDFFYLSIGAAWIFSETVIQELFKDRLFNAHGSRLPNNRGGGGFSWQILMGNKFGFCILHKVEAGIDTGQIVAFEEFLYPASLRIPLEFDEFLYRKYLVFLKNFVLSCKNSIVYFKPLEQFESFSSYWPRLKTDINGWINWNWNPYDIEKFICAFDDPYRGAQTRLNDKKVFLKGVSLSPQDGNFHPYQSGLIYRVSNSWICVAIKSSTLIITGLYDEEQNNLISHVRVGDRFITPSVHLDESFKRVYYGPD